MSDSIQHLEPKALWAHFDELRRIPRAPRKEERVRQWVLDIAQRHGYATESDDAGNIVVRVPATAGNEQAPTVVLQGHLDMVCEKNADTDFDFDHDELQLRLDGDILTADGTTLGADNGVAVAAALALATDPPAAHGPLELLFTVSEEIGLVGAQALDPSIVSGRLLLNLDTEEEGYLTIGCAGSRGAYLDFPAPRDGDGGGHQACRVRVRGARGGHSGVDIHLGRANAVKILADVLRRLDAVQLVNIQGGNAGNAIPREAEAILFADAAAVDAAVDAASDAARSEHGDSDPDLVIEVSRDDLAHVRLPAPLGTDASRRLVQLLHKLPSGVLAMSPDLPDLVQTSNTVATVRTTAGTGDGDRVEILSACRSSRQQDMETTTSRAVELARSLGGDGSSDRGYPGWQPNPASPLLRRAQAVYQSMFGRAPEVSAVHAGLECGLIGEKIPGMDMISFGPTIRNPHSPDELVSVSSVRRVLGDYLAALLAELAENPPDR